MARALEASAYTCVHKLWKDYYYYPCGKKADSSGLCGRHKPEAIAASKARRDAKAKERYASHQRKWDEQKERERRADAYPKLIAMLQRAAMDENYEADDCLALLEELGELASMPERDEA
jgi:hypothetical protein